MRSKIALFIAVVGLLSLLPSLLIALQTPRTSLQFEYMPLDWNGWIAVGQAFVAPIGLFAMAAVVEMLFRISEKLPFAPAVVVPAERRLLFTWRSTIAKTFVGVALVLYIVIGIATLSYFQSGQDIAPGVPEDQRFQYILQIAFNWAVWPLEFIAWAAVIEYLSRIARALSAARADGEVGG
jgi:hypothetical protein